MIRYFLIFVFLFSVDSLRADSKGCQGSVEISVLDKCSDNDFTLAKYVCKANGLAVSMSVKQFTPLMRSALGNQFNKKIGLCPNMIQQFSLLCFKSEKEREACLNLINNSRGSETPQQKEEVTKLHCEFELEASDCSQKSGLNAYSCINDALTNQKIKSVSGACQGSLDRIFEKFKNILDDGSCKEKTLKYCKDDVGYSVLKCLLSQLNSYSDSLPPTCKNIVTNAAGNTKEQAEKEFPKQAVSQGAPTTRTGAAK